MTFSKQVIPSTVLTPHYSEGPVYISSDVRMQQRFFTYKTDTGVVAGWDATVTFTIDRTAAQVWPHLKDFNKWQNSHGYYYTGAVGDLYDSVEGDLGEEVVYIDIKMPNRPPERFPYGYRVLRVIPERLIVVFSPVPKDGSNGGVSNGFTVIMLDEHEGKSRVNILMEHAMRTAEMREENAPNPWRDGASEIERFWCATFIPKLKELCCGGN